LGTLFSFKSLKKSKLLKAKKLGYKVTRYYPKAVKANESDILDHVMHPTRRKIILFLLEHSNCRFKEIVHYIDRAQSTTLFQVQRLEYAMIISVIRVDKNNQFYRLKNRARIIKTVSKYKITV
jgi:predicted transcriptional regulator